MTHQAQQKAAHVNDVGTKFVITFREGKAVLPIQSATSLIIFLLPPDDVLDPATTALAEIVAGAATLVTNGEDGKAQYATVAGDLPVPGRWGVQGRVTLTSPAGTWSSEVGWFQVLPNLDSPEFLTL